MTPALAKAAYVLLAVAWYVIRFPHALRARRAPVVHSARGGLESALLLISLTGLGIIPFVYVASGFPRLADYHFNPVQAWAGVVVALAAIAMFHLTHRTLGRMWSVSLDVREDHKLITIGIYRYLRHPMYSAFWLWAVAQALLLPNWIAGFSGLVGFGTLYFFRVRREERLMLKTFGDSYRSYMQRTKRIIPWLY
jgi:protein-S-isoprenylcysteine O-methyltransferase Ste14